VFTDGRDVVTRAHDDDPLSLQDSIDGVVRSMQGGERRPSGQAQAMGGVFGRWSEIVGENVAAHVQPVRLDGARLVVEVTDPAWATQIRRLSDTLRTRVREVAGTTIETVEVRVAGGRPKRR
jgi:predicted nucleic acid-binding Zn ribbon protein